MKKKTVSLLVMLMLCLFACSSALAYDANTAQAWLAQFAQALSSISPVNDPSATTDPARGGAVLLAYDFGTVLAEQMIPKAEDIKEIEIRSGQVTDCRGVRVGMGLGSGLSEDDYRTAISCGIRKINYYTYQALAGGRGIYDAVAQYPQGLYFHDAAMAAMKSMREDVTSILRTFGGDV